MTRYPVHVKTRMIPQRACPKCNALIDAVTGASMRGPTGTIPTDGCLTACAYCGAILILLERSFQFATLDQWHEVQPELRAMLESMLNERLGHGAYIHEVHGEKNDSSI